MSFLWDITIVGIRQGRNSVNTQIFCSLSLSLSKFCKPLFQQDWCIPKITSAVILWTPLPLLDSILGQPPCCLFSSESPAAKLFMEAEGLSVKSVNAQRQNKCLVSILRWLGKAYRGCSELQKLQMYKCWDVCWVEGSRYGCFSPRPTSQRGFRS